MSLLDSLLGQQNSGSLLQIAERFGIDSGQLQNIVTQIAPALSSGLMHHTEQNGLSSLMGLLGHEGHAQYIANPDLLQQPQATAAGNGILSKLFGTKDVSRQVADTTSQNTGVSSDIIKKMLPVLAIMAVSALSKKTQQSAPQGNTPVQGEGLLGELKQFLSGGQQQSIASEVMGLLRQHSA